MSQRYLGAMLFEHLKTVRFTCLLINSWIVSQPKSIQSDLFDKRFAWSIKIAIGHDACCSVLEPLQLSDISGIATAPSRAAVVEVRLNDASIKNFCNCFREKMLGKL